MQFQPQWSPWPDKPSFILDVIRHLPRSVFSDKQMEVILWSHRSLGISEVPSVFVLKTIDKHLQSCCGIETIRYKGPLGHVYYINDLGTILAQVSDIYPSLYSLYNHKSSV